MVRNTIVTVAALAVIFLSACSHGGGEKRQAAGVPAGMMVARQAFPSGSADSSAVLLETHAPARVRVGENYSYEIHVTNLTGARLHGVEVSDTLSGAFERHGSEPRVSHQSGERPFWLLGTLEPEESRIIRISGVARGAGTVTSCAEVSWKNALCVSTEVVDPQIALAMAGGGEAQLAQSFAIEFSVHNPGSGEATQVVIDHVLPEGWIGPEEVSELHFDIGTLPAGETRSVRALVTPTQRGAFVFQADAHSAEGLSSRSEPLDVRVVNPELRIEVQSAAREYLGKRVNFEITLSNIGDGGAQKAEVEAKIPDGTIFDAAEGGGILEGDRVVWRGFDVKAKHQSSMSFSVIANQIGVAETVVRAEALGCDAVATGGSTTIEGISAILLEVVDLVDPVPVGGNSSYRITVTNQGTSINSGISIDCDLEDSMEYVGSEGPTTGVLIGRTLSFSPLKGLVQGASVSWTVTVRATSAGDVRFVATLNSDQLERPVPEAEATKFYR